MELRFAIESCNMNHQIILTEYHLELPVHSRVKQRLTLTCQTEDFSYKPNVKQSLL